MTEVEKKGKLWEMYNFAAAAGDMPLKSYLAIHPKAKLEKKDIVILRNYVLSLSNFKINDSAGINHLNKQQKQLLMKKDSKEIPVAPNGIAFISDYKNWQIVSISERFDSGTMRIVYGNQKDIKAIHDNQTNPWPDGVIMAKILWAQLKNEYGEIKPDEYKYIQFMINDNKKYEKSKGWGFSRFDNLNNEPLGKENFEYLCINCHNEVRDQDYVFT
ncbi:MAG: cytochrome P460 family protein [Flavobacterium sp.]|nr:cytochrome P460 family protein [Flavobacterium sp.]